MAYLIYRISYQFNPNVRDSCAYAYGVSEVSGVWEVYGVSHVLEGDYDSPERRIDIHFPHPNKRVLIHRKIVWGATLIVRRQPEDIVCVFS